MSAAFLLELAGILLSLLKSSTPESPLLYIPPCLTGERVDTVVAELAKQHGKDRVKVGDIRVGRRAGHHKSCFGGTSD